MDEERRPIYRNFAYTFIAIGLSFLLIDIVERIFPFDFLQGNATPVALLVGGVGVALLWTARSKKDGDS